MYHKTETGAAVPAPTNPLSTRWRPMAAMVDAGLEGSTLFCLTDDTREMVDEVSERFATIINNFTDSRVAQERKNKRAAVACGWARPLSPQTLPN